MTEEDNGEFIHMSEEEQREFKEMKEWFRKVKYGSVFVTAFFAFCMAVGGAYLMLKSIIVSK